MSSEAKDAAAVICRRLKLGCKLSEVINNKKDAVALFELFKDEGYILTQSDGKYCVSSLLNVSHIFKCYVPK